MADRVSSFLRKPVDIEELISSLQDAVASQKDLSEEAGE